MSQNKNEAIVKRTKWDSRADSTARKQYEEEEGKEGRREGFHNEDGIYCSAYEPRWNKRHLVFLYEATSYNKFGPNCERSTQLQSLSRNQTAIVETKVYIERVDYPDSEDSWLSGSEQTSQSRFSLGPYPKPPKVTLDCSHTFLWLYKSKKGFCLEAKLAPAHAKVARLDKKDPLGEHFLKINHCNPYLFGKQHHNRFKIGTKVYILEGYFSGLHRVVVGHKQGFDLLDERTGPILKILIVNIAGVYEVQNSLSVDSQVDRLTRNFTVRNPSTSS